MPRRICLALLLLASVVLAEAQAQLPVLPPPSPVVPAPPPSVPVLTVAEFARVFKPLPGRYEVLVLHPFTNCPVKVCFTLPAGCPRSVKMHHRRRLEFDYGKCEVNLIFDRRGGVKVDYDN
jgi:hypothetical protein